MLRKNTNKIIGNRSFSNDIKTVKQLGKLTLKYLNKYFNSLGIPSKIKDHSDNIEQYDIIICSKSDVDSAVNIKKKYPHLLVGVINLAADKLNLPIDFIITGSLEEMDSLSSYENVFLFPLIEKIYNNMPIKKHIDRQIIRLGFHVLIRMPNQKVEN